MPRTFLTPRSLWRSLFAAAVVSVLVATAAPAWAQSASVRYQRAMAREKTARSATTSVATIRAIARYYEGIVRAYPRSGYCDNALWQAAGLMQLAHERSRAAADLESARRLLTWLRREYPTSALAKQATARLAALRVSPRSTTTTARATKAAEPPARAAAAPAPEPPGPAPGATTEKSHSAPTAPPVVSSPSASTPAAAPAVVTSATRPVPPVVTMADPPASPPVDVSPPARAPASGTAVPREEEAAGEVPKEVLGDDKPKRVETLPALPMPPPASASPPAPARREGATALREITHTKLPKGDRIVIELGRETPYTTRRQTRPDRVQIDVADAALAGGLADRVESIGGSHVKSVSVGKGTNSGSRIVLELTGEPRFSTFPLYNPFRLVVDLESDAAEADARNSRETERTAAAPPTPPPSLPSPTTPSSTSRGDYSLARQLGLSVSRVVIDPGHGGHDPGARAHGVSEAEIVLDVALRVERLLRAQPGFEVVLTRRTNEFIPLEERTALANRENADMFLSIHVNASPRAATRGIETYLLDFATNSDAEALAARENASSVQTMRLLPDLVKAIALNNKVDESRELATMVQSSLVRRMSPLNKGLQDLGVKRAPFVVLIGAQMPSVLAEISFLTNRTDASLLKQASHRQRIAEALADGVLRYRASLKTTAPARTAAR